MLINAQPRVVSHLRFNPPESRSSSRTSNCSTRKRGFFAMSSNSQNSQSMPQQVSGHPSLVDGWEWGMEGLDQESYGESFGIPLYSDAQDAESYYGQRTSHISMASANAIATQAYAYFQPTQFAYARSTPVHHTGNNASYSSMGYCRPAALHNESSSETDYSHSPIDVTSLYSNNCGLGLGLANPYIPTSNPQAFQYGLDKSSWYNPEPQINTDVTISPAMAGATMCPQPSQQSWSQSFGSVSSPSSGLSPAEGSARYHSYEGSELSFSDTDAESEHASDVDIIEERAIRNSNGSTTYTRERKRVKGPGHEATVDSKVYPRPIAPNPQSDGTGVSRVKRMEVAYSSQVPSHDPTSANLPLRRPATSRDEERDRLLVELKRQGYSYKDIKRRGNFKEAESTLRGRYRTLTKAKEERVRRPCWTEKDRRLLREGVMRYGGRDRVEERNVTVVGGRGEPQLTYGKVKWMQVAAYIKERGGSYHFGNATCRKRWDEMVRAEREEVRRRESGEFMRK